MHITLQTDNKENCGSNAIIINECESSLQSPNTCTCTCNLQIQQVFLKTVAIFVYLCYLSCTIIKLFFILIEDLFYHMKIIFPSLSLCVIV